MLRLIRDLNLNASKPMRAFYDRTTTNGITKQVKIERCLIEENTVLASWY